MSDDDDEIDAWLDSSDDDEASEGVDGDARDASPETRDDDDENDDDVFDGKNDDDDDDDDARDGRDGKAVTPEETTRDDGSSSVTDDADRAASEGETETTTAARGDETTTTTETTTETEKASTAKPPPSPPSDAPDVGKLAMNLGGWASASLAKAKAVVKEAAASDAARALRRDLKTFSSHVVGDDGARTRVVREDDDDAEDGNEDARDDAPKTADAVRLAETFASGAWAAFGGAANKAKRALEKAEGVIENAASDPKTFATNVTKKTQSVGMGAFSALTSVVKATADVLAGDEDDDERAAAILVERLADFGAATAQAHVEVACERAMDALLNGASEDAQRRVRELVRELDATLTAEQSAANAAPPASPGDPATLVAVPLGDDAARAHDVESSVLVALIAAVDARAEEIGETLASTSGSSRDNFADTVAAFEEALDELRDECVCDGLAKLSTTTLEKIVRVVDSIRGGDWLDVDPVPAAVLARERVAGYDDDVKIFIEATKEATTALARRAHDALRDVWPRDAPTLLDVADASFEQLARDERACVDVTRRTLRQLAWVIAASSK